MRGTKTLLSECPSEHFSGNETLGTFYVSYNRQRVGQTQRGARLNSMQAWLTTARNIFHVVENFALLAKE